MQPFVELLFLTTGAWFWFITAIVVIVITVLEEIGRGTAATVTLLLFASGIFIANPQYRELAQAQPIWIAVGFLLYILAGTGWGVLKWMAFTRKWSDRIEDAQNSWRRYNKKEKSDALTEQETASMWASVHSETYMHNYYGPEGRSGKTHQPPPTPRAINYKGRIITWMSYWPFSAAWTLIDDPMRRVWLAIYRKIGKLLDAIGDRAAKRIQVKTIPNPEPIEPDIRLRKHPYGDR